MNTIVVRQTTEKDIVLRNLQVFGIESTELHKANRIIPFGIGVNRDIDIQFTRLVRKIRFELAILPSFQILAQRSFEQEMEILVASTETEHKERFNAFFVTASRFKRNAKPAPVAIRAAIMLRGIDRKNRIGRTTVKPEIKIRTNLEIALVRRRIRRFCKSQSRSKST